MKKRKILGFVHIDGRSIPQMCSNVVQRSPLRTESNYHFTWSVQCTRNVFRSYLGVRLRVRSCDNYETDHWCSFARSSVLFSLYVYSFDFPSGIKALQLWLDLMLDAVWFCAGVVRVWHLGLLLIRVRCCKLHSKTQHQDAHLRSVHGPSSVTKAG